MLVDDWLHRKMLNTLGTAGDGNIGWSGRPLLAPKPKAADPLPGPSRTTSGSGSVLPIVCPAIWSR